ncbi:MAG TPA: hypothetical protein VI942_12700 [Thermoanaerobaculia bacterium]|nr:hypothetical protein [Thermoanaerobaculia bacterium]
MSAPVPTGDERPAGAPGGAPPPPASRSARRELLASALLFVALFAVYQSSEKRQLLDPKYALLAADTLLARGTWDLRPFFPELRCVSERRALRATGEAAPWQLGCRQGRIVYRYGPGTPLLSLPFVALARAAGRGVLDADGGSSRRGEIELQAWLAALLTAATGVLVGRAARRELGVAASAGVGLAAGLGTTLWSVASRSLWAHTWSALLVAAIVVELLRWEEGRRRRPIVLGLLAVAAFWVRPTNAIVAGAVALFVALRHRRALGALVATGAAGAAAYALLTRHLSGELLPTFVTHVPGLFGRTSTLEAAAGLLVSPLVGLLVFTPVLVAIAVLLATLGVPERFRAVSLWALAVVVAHYSMMARFGGWWGGGAMGPRFFTEMVPLWAWLGVAAWAGVARRTPAQSWRRRATATALVALAFAGVVANGAVATRLAGDYGRPRGELRQRLRMNQAPRAVWEWREAPYLAVWRALVASPEQTKARGLESRRGTRGRPR